MLKTVIIASALTSILSLSGCCKKVEPKIIVKTKYVYQTFPDELLELDTLPTKPNLVKGNDIDLARYLSGLKGTAQSCILKHSSIVDIISKNKEREIHSDNR